MKPEQYVASRHLTHGRRPPIGHDGAVSETPRYDGFDELRVAGLTLRGITQGGVETCLMVPELKVMFDVGRCPPGSKKFDNILVSHGHSDHLGGLPYLVSQRAMNKQVGPRVHFPEEILDPLQRILSAWREIERFEPPVTLVPRKPGDEFKLSKNLTGLALRTTHRVPSLAYVVTRESQRLKAEFSDREGEQLRDLRARGVAITEPHSEPLLCVTGDTQIEFFDEQPIARRCSVLVYEVTSWDDRRTPEQTRAWGHTHIDEMIERAEQFEGEALVLVHRSLRHGRRDAERVVAERFPAAVRDRVHVFGT